MPRLLYRQKPLDVQLLEARTPEERDAIILRMRAAEAGQDGECARPPNGLLVDGRDPFAAVRRAAREAHDGRPDPQEEQHMAMSQSMPAHLNQRPLSQVEPPLAGTAPEGKKRGGWKVARKPAEERKHEVLYCAGCGRQVTEGECITVQQDVCMTSYGGLMTITRHCRAHAETVVSLATYFVVKPQPAAGQGAPSAQ